MYASSKLMRGVLVLLALTGAAPQVRPVLAEACRQPTETGCPVDMNQAVTAILTDPNDVHTWRFTVTQPASVHIALTNLPVDYDLHVYAADGTLIGESTSEGTQDDVLDLPAAAAGTYMVYVNSPRGDVDPTNPYTLEVDAPSVATAAASERPTATPTPAPGTVLLADNFADSTQGWLPTNSPDPTHYDAGYVNGEYRLLRTDGGNAAVVPRVLLPGTYHDVSIAVDVHLVGETTYGYLRIRCRNGSGGTGYGFGVEPGNRSVTLTRYDGTGKPEVSLVNWTPSATISKGTAANHLQLSCAGQTIAASINGTSVFSVLDPTYSTGTIQLELHGSGTPDARLDNLVVTQQ